MKRNPLNLKKLKEYISFLPTQIKKELKDNLFAAAMLGKLYQVYLSCGSQQNFYVGDREIMDDLGTKDFRLIGRTRVLLISKNYIQYRKGHFGTTNSHYDVLFCQHLEEENASTETPMNTRVPDDNKKENASTKMEESLLVLKMEEEMLEMKSEIQHLKELVERLLDEKNQHLCQHSKEMEICQQERQQENALEDNELDGNFEDNCQHLEDKNASITYNLQHITYNNKHITSNLQHLTNNNNNINKNNNNIIEKNGDINNILNVREEEPNELENNEELFKNIKPLEEVSKGTEDDGFDFQIKFSYDLSKTKTMKELQSLKNKIEQERKRMKPNPNGYYTQLLEKLVKEKEEELTPTDQVSFSTKSLNRELQDREELEEARLASQVANMSMFSEPIDDFPF